MKGRDYLSGFIIQITILVLVSSFAFAQGDTILSYNSIRGIKQIIPPLPYDTTVIIAHSASSIGLLPGVMDFALLNNYCPYDTADPRCPIDDNYSLENYPLRCMVRIKSYKNGELRTGCSGTLIGRDFVLTAAHCVLNLDDTTFPNDWPDSIIIAPAFDTTVNYPELGHFISHQFYLLNGFTKDFIDSQDYENEDIALLKLDSSAGLKIGWVSIGFSGDSTFYVNNIFYCLGYPGECDFFHPNLCYDFGLMYYQRIFFYSSLMGGISSSDKFISNPWLSYFPSVVQGYSGSSIINDNNGILVCYGIPITQIYVSRINRPLYFAFKDIMDADSTSPTIYNYTDFNFNTFPNPTAGPFYLNCTVPENMQITTTLFNPLGQYMGAWHINVLQGYSTQQIDPGPLPEGVYLLQITGSTGILNTSKILISGK